jgi:hypothetical protein
MSAKIHTFAAILCFTSAAQSQAQNAPNVSQVLMYSATTGNVTVPTLNGSNSFVLPKAVSSIFTETALPANLADSTGGNILNAANYGISRNMVQLNNALNASIATALSIIPLSSPASGVILKKDPATGVDLPVSSTLGPLFTERAETLGKGRLYVGFSNQDFHFTSFNGTSLNALSILYPGGDPSKVVLNAPASTVPATFGLGLDVKLSQNIAFFTYGVLDRLDVSLGIPTVHAAVSGRTYNGTIYSGNGFGTFGSNCWCVNTFTPGYPTLTQERIGESSMSKTGFGDLLVRVKGTVLAKPNVVVAVGGDLRLPTGDEQNYLGVGTLSVKPFTALSFYTKPLHNGIVVSPHFDVGWQFSGKSTLGGELQGTPMTQQTDTGTVNYIAAPFHSTKDYLPDVLNWAVGTEVALGRQNTVVVDILGNQVGWIHGIPNAQLQTIQNVLLPTGPNGDSTGNAVPVKTSASGLVSVGRVSYGQYSASFGYKARLTRTLVANFNLVVRLDDNGLVARAVPMFGLGYSF